MRDSFLGFQNSWRGPVSGIALILVAFFTVTGPRGRAQTQPTTLPPRVQTDLQPWQKRRIAFFKIARAARKEDPGAQSALDAIAAEYERSPIDRTPMENLDILGVCYVPKDGAGAYTSRPSL
jgi:hypothetical protein